MCGGGGGCCANFLGAGGLCKFSRVWCDLCKFSRGGWGFGAKCLGVGGGFVLLR